MKNYTRERHSEHTWHRVRTVHCRRHSSTNNKQQQQHFYVKRNYYLLCARWLVLRCHCAACKFKEINLKLALIKRKNEYLTVRPNDHRIVYNGSGQQIQ